MLMHQLETCSKYSAPSTQHILQNTVRHPVHCSVKYTLNNVKTSDATGFEFINVRNYELNFQCSYIETRSEEIRI